MHSFQIEISTKDNILFQGNADYVTLKSYSGILGITANTTQLLGAIVPCNVTITTDYGNKTSHTIPCKSGFYFKYDKILKIILQ